MPMDPKLTTLTALPTELTLLIIANLPLASIAALQRVNHYFAIFVAENESTIYRNTAWVEGWVPSQETQLGELRVVQNTTAGDEEEERKRSEALYSRRAMRNVQGWKDFCYRRKSIFRAWAACAPSTILPSPRSREIPPLLNVRQRSPYRRVHRIKVDERVGLILTTTAVGGIVVRDLESDDVLWELPTWYVPAYAHLEYEQGYMIFTRADGNTEVWRRTEVPSSSALLASHPDEQQLRMAERLSTMVLQTRPCARAQFTPYAVFVTPEPTRASRFVFPTLLVSSLERAFLWDIPTGVRVQTLEGIQVVLPLMDFDAPAEGVAEDEVGDEGGDEDEDMVLVDDDSADEGDVMLPLHPNPTDVSDGELTDDADLIEDHPLHLQSMMEPPTGGSSEGDQDEVENHVAEPDDEDDEDDNDMLPRFLGLIRYVEISDRHVVIVGRYLLRVFSRATGKAILDVPSTRPRYGAARWEIASAAWAEGTGVGDDHVACGAEKGKGKQKADNYETARIERRELVRMPLRFTYEEWTRSPRLVIDQFIAAHLSSDGQHLVALLSGLRVLVIPFFETLSVGPTTPPPAPTPNETPASTSTDSETTKAVLGQRRVADSLQSLRDARRRLQREREKEVFSRILDVQLGAPRAANSVYLAYEHGRIGVVTMNAVYVITPNIPETSRSAIPNLTVSRVPFFSNPSLLSAVSCLMMSDTGMYLNWNPALPPNYTLGNPFTGESDDWENEDEDEDEDSRNPWVKWEREYQLELESYETSETERYHTLPNGDMFVAREPRGTLEQSHLSTVYTINFAPDDSEESASAKLFRRSTPGHREDVRMQEPDS